MPIKLCSWKSVHIKRKPHINICFEGRLALRRKQNISGFRLKLKTKCLFLLDCWPTVVCLLLTGSFPINTPSTSKDLTILPRFLPSKSFCCHGNLVFSGNPVGDTLWYIHGTMFKLCLMPPWGTRYILSQRYQFLLAVIQGVNSMLQFIENQDYLKIKAASRKGEGGLWLGPPFHIIKQMP